MNEQYKVKNPVQILKGSNSRKFIPVPLVGVGNLTPLRDAAADATSELHGTGVQLSGNFESGEGEFAVLAEDSRRLPFGNWIIKYRYSHDEGTNSHELFLAAEIAA
jgi:hypothetical protein